MNNLTTALKSLDKQDKALICLPALQHIAAMCVLNVSFLSTSATSVAYM